MIDIIARELSVNMLIHRDYFCRNISRMIIERDKMYTENASKSVREGYINVNKFSPYPKNPIIANFFREIDLSEELGSGIRKMVKYVKIYSNRIPKFKDGDIFITEVPLNCFEHVKSKGEIVRIDEISGKYEKIILDFCTTARTGREIQEYIGIKDREHFRKKILKPMIEKELLLLTIPDKPNSRNQKYITPNG